MILKKVKIYNYRQLQKVELDLQNSLTVLAGPNNSGKTTLISVLKGMFRDKKLSFTYSDIPTNLSTSWVEKIIPVFQSIMVENDKNTGISEIIKKISVDDKLLPEYTIECFHAEIQVDYDPTGDDIQLFADYLMDLDESKHSFYFIYSYEPSIASFEKYLGECYDKMSSRFLDISNPDCKEKETKLYFIKEELLKLYCHASLEKCYFCNSNYENANSIEIIAFKNLFNFRDIPAIRELDDHESDTSKGISKRIIALLKGNEKWEEVTKKLPDLLMAQIEDSGAKKEIKNSSIKSLDETVQDISKTSGGHIGKLQLEMDVNENVVEDFIQKITRAKYDIDGLLLNEQSQGLGFSNLIYLHMRLEEFYKSVDDSKVNVFFIEEPESHMHPQMQNVFIEILTMLKMKSLIITDLDYNKDATTFEIAKNSTSTNATINHCYRLIYPEKGAAYLPSIKEIYEMQTEKGTVICNDLICVAYQDENSTARTLEEAMLNKFLSKNVFDKTKRSEWKSIRKNNNLTFTIPNNRNDETDSEFSIRQIVAASSNNKTDFMYSVVLSGNEEKMLPDYIRKGLLWLAK